MSEFKLIARTISLKFVWSCITLSDSEFQIKLPQ